MDRLILKSMLSCINLILPNREESTWIPSMLRSRLWWEVIVWACYFSKRGMEKEIIFVPKIQVYFEQTKEDKILLCACALARS